MNTEIKDDLTYKIIGESKTSQYAEHFGFSSKKAQRHLRKMRDLGIIGDNGEFSNSPTYRYVYIHKED